MRNVYIIFIGICISQSAFADSWAKAYGDTSDDVTRDISQTKDGGYILAGETRSYGAGSYDFLIIKLDSIGNIQWAKTFGDSTPDAPHSVLQTSDNGYIVAGETWPFGAGSNDCLVIKLDSIGVLEWAKTFGGTNVEEAHSVLQTLDNGYIIAGHTASFGAGWSDCLVIKLDSLGTMEWGKTFGGTEVDYAEAILQTSDGGYIVSGTTESYGAGVLDLLVIKLTSTGVVEWTKTFGGLQTEEWAYSISQTPDNGYILGGTTDSYGAGLWDLLIIKIDSTGNVEWTKTFGGSDYDYTRSILHTSDNGYLVTGDFEMGTGSHDILIIKLNSLGSPEWIKTFGGSLTDISCFGSSSVQTSAGDYIIAGSTWSYGAGRYDCLVMKIEADGSMGAGCPIRDYNPDTSSPIVTVTSPSLDISLPSLIVNNCTPETSSVTPIVTEICGGTGIEERESQLQSLNLKAHPNPFIQSTVISYELLTTKNQQLTTLKIYDVAGKLIHTLVDKEMGPGYYNINWYPRELKGGIYFAKLNAGNYSLTKKLILLY